MYIDWNDVKEADKNFMENAPHIKPTYCSFDIECNSKNHNARMPDPEIPENKVIQISMIFGTLGDKNSRIKYILSLGKPEYVENSDHILIFKDEPDLLLGFSKLIRKYDPDVFTGYNIIKFDMGYLIKRA